MLILAISLIFIALLITTIYYAAIKDYDNTNSDEATKIPIDNEEEIEGLKLTIMTQNSRIKDLEEQLGNKSSMRSNQMSLMLSQENKIVEFSSSQSCPICKTCPTCPTCPHWPDCPDCPICPDCPDCPVCPPPCPDACTITDGPKFLSVTATSEIYLNEYNSCKYYDTQLLSSEVTTETTKYISGGEKVTIYNIVNKNTYKVLQQFEHAASGCFIHSLGNSAFCCSLGGKVWKYDLDATPITESVFYIEVYDKYYSCIESDKDDYLLILGLPNEYKIIDNVGTKLKTHSSSQGSVYFSDSEEFKPYQIAERHPGEFIIAHTNRLSIIHTFASFEQRIFTDTRSVLSLKTSNYLVIGGRHNREGRVVGGAVGTFIYIKGGYEIIEITDHFGYGGENCIITILQELEEGTLIFGGKENCNEWCIWKYMEADSEPICVPYINQISKKVLDIIPILI